MADYLVVGLFGSVLHDRQPIWKESACDRQGSKYCGKCIQRKWKVLISQIWRAHFSHQYYEVWNYVNRFATFNRFTNSPVANYKGELYSMPFNMYTFNKM